MPTVDINNLVVLDTLDVPGFQEIDSSTTATHLDTKTDEVEDELKALIACAGLQETDIAEFPTGQTPQVNRDLRLLAMHLILREYFAHLATELEDEGFASKRDHHAAMVVRQQRMVLGLDKDCNPIGPVTVHLVAGEEPDTKKDDMRLISVVE